MTSHFTTGYLLSMLMGCILLASPAEAQIKDDDASKRTLAAHCAISGGGNEADYQSYASSLAKTLSQLSVPEQQVVFGDVDGSGTGSIGDGSGASTESGDPPSDGGAEEESGGWEAFLSWLNSLWSASSESGRTLQGETSTTQLAANSTSVISFGSVVITETITTGNTDKSGAFTQVRHPSGKVILREESTNSDAVGKLEFKNRKLEFLNQAEDK